MGRHRKDGNPQGLEKRVYWHHGQFRYRYRTGEWEDLGTDVVKANERARALNDPSGYGSFLYWLDRFIAAAKSGALPAGWKLGARTIVDYGRERDFIAVSPLAKMAPLQLAREPHHIADYRDHRVIDGKGEVQANHGLSLLSSTFRWLIEKGMVKGLTLNPVLLISRYTREAKDRYVEDHEYQPVFSIAQRSVCMALTLAYKTLQRPTDLLLLPPAAVRSKSVAGAAKRVLSVTQGKTGRTVDIELDDGLEEALRMLTPDGCQLGTVRLSSSITKIVPTLIHTTAGRPYTEMGLGAMLRRYCYKASVRTFGLMDVRAKGATDMYLRRVPLEDIQLLMGHASVQTTEIYIKRLLATVRIAQPNQRAIA